MKQVEPAQFRSVFLLTTRSCHIFPSCNTCWKPLTGIVLQVPVSQTQKISGQTTHSRYIYIFLQGRSKDVSCSFQRKMAKRIGWCPQLWGWHFRMGNPGSATGYFIMFMSDKNIILVSKKPGSANGRRKDACADFSSSAQENFSTILESITRVL